MTNPRAASSHFSFPLGRVLLGLALLFLLTGCAAQTSPASVETGPAPAATPDAGASSESQESLIPFDPAVRRGELDNGLEFYIRRNVKPESRAELRLVVNAGSILEDEDQRGLAHFVEHMAFNGTKNFEKQELVEIGRFYSLPETCNTGFRCDLHPRWGHSGRLVCIDSIHEAGERQMYVIDVSEVVG